MTTTNTRHHYYCPNAVKSLHRSCIQIHFTATRVTAHTVALYSPPENRIRSRIRLNQVSETRLSRLHNDVRLLTFLTALSHIYPTWNAPDGRRCSFGMHTVTMTTLFQPSTSWPIRSQVKKVRYDYSVWPISLVSGLQQSKIIHCWTNSISSLLLILINLSLTVCEVADTR